MAAGPDPDLVLTRGDLARELEVLRRSAAQGTGKATVSLRDLAKRLDVPSSTLHNYVRGRTLIPIDVLDAVVIELGASPAEQARWADAWLRVAAGSDNQAARNSPDLGDFLRQARLRTGLTPEDLATKVGLGVQAVQALERGERGDPERLTVDLLGDALGLSPAERETLASLVAPPPVADLVHQLPADDATFVGRADEVAAAVDALSTTDSCPVVVVAGMAGVGKSTLAVHVAHVVANRFPDGQLFVDMGGAEPVTPSDALRTVLHSLGVRDSLPSTTGDLAAMMRSLLTGKRVLIVLDDAADAAQLGPMLPASGGCAVLVTTRTEVAVLPHDLLVRLGPLAEGEAVDLLAQVVGRARVDAEVEASTSLVRFCDLLPLAVRIAAARLKARPEWTVAHLAARVGDERHRLDELQVGEIGVRATFEVSFAQLSRSGGAVDQAAVDAYPLIAVCAAAEVDVVEVGRLLDIDERSAERVLERLADLNLLAAAEPGRYRQFDLLRAVGVERARHVPAERRGAALERVIDLYAGVAWRGVALANPHSPRLRWATAREPAVAFTTAAEVFDWLYARRNHLVQVFSAACDDAAVAPDAVLGAVPGLMEFFRAKAWWTGWADTCAAGLVAAARSRDTVLVATVRSDAAIAYAEVAARTGGPFEVALGHAAGSVDAVAGLGDPTLLATMLNNQCYALSLAGEHAAAVDAGERSVALSAATGDLMLQAITTVTVGRLIGLRGDLDGEERRYRDAERMADELGVVHVQAYALHQLGTVHRRRGALAEAVSVLDRSATMWRSLGDWHGEELALAELGDVQRSLGCPTAAATAYRAARDLTVAGGWMSEHARLSELIAQLA